MRSDFSAALRIGRLTLAALVLYSACLPPGVARCEQHKTYFEGLQRAWAVGELSLSRKMLFREGRLLAFPGRITDLVYARVGKPQTVLVVHELKADEDDAPFGTESRVFAALTVLPHYKFWRDNLPNTPRHEVMGGGKYAFSGAALEPASRLTKAWVVSFDQKGSERWRTQNSVLAGALVAGVPVLRQDAVRQLSKQLPLTKVVDDPALAHLTDFVASDQYPDDERARVVEAIGGGELKDLSPTLKKIARGDDVVAAAALAALAKLGQNQSTEALLQRKNAKTEEIRLYVYGALGAQSAEDGRAFAAAADALANDSSMSVRSAAAQGLGRSGNARAVGALTDALLRGDASSRAAASALAAVGNPEALEALKSALTTGESTEAMVAAVLGIGEILPSCPECRTFLGEQRDTHGEQAVRDLIGIVLADGLPAAN